MRRTLFYTTMVNHRPVYAVVGSSAAAAAATAATTSTAAAEAPRQFRATAARDPNDPNPNVPAQPALRDFLARSTQPIFSVSAMFGVRSGGNCGSCGH